MTREHPTGEVPPERTVPRATYRLQLGPDFVFDDAARLVPHLAELGISHLYLSPVLEAVPGSTHGYDVTDPGRIREELGGPAGLERLRDAARAAGLGLVVDIVPNHVALASPANPWWWDVLRHGPGSRYAGHLDIAWRPGRHGQPTLLLPELGAPPEAELEAGRLTLTHVAGGERPGWRVVSHDRAWPTRPGSLASVGLDEDDVDATLRAVRHDPCLLAELLDHQHYRLAHWRQAAEELDHRRFFDITGLGGVRVEDPGVFDDAHAAIVPRVTDGTIDGLRIDHPDGLRDPGGYVERLRERVGPRPWIVVEKILAPGEDLPADWPVDGTVGYRFADLALGVHLDPGAREVLDDLHRTLTGAPVDRTRTIDEALHAAAATLFAPERRRVARHLADAIDGLGPADAEVVVTELAVAWPVYRTYVRPATGAVRPADRRVVDLAVARVRARDTVAASVLERVRRVLLLEDRGDAATAFVGAFQQLTGPVVAKGIEDTVMYRDLAYVATNEVGAEPGHLGHGLGALHEHSAWAAANEPASMLTTSTHDTKRSEDVRTRLAVLSQDVRRWVDDVLRLRQLMARHRGPQGPAPAHEHLAIQTLVGAWPISADRLTGYLRKAAREGKQQTSWLDPDERYEADLEGYVRGVLGDPEVVTAVEEVVGRIREAGWLTSLSLVALKLTSPGVPDVYQGTELWDLSLVDPDNRRPVDHDLRRRLMAELGGTPSPQAVLARIEEGVPKLWLTRELLRLRAEHPAAFRPGAGYRPLWAHGDRARNVAAYARGGEVVVVAPVLVHQLGPGFATWSWSATSLVLPDGRWVDRLGGGSWSGEVRLASLLGRFPVAVLTREG